MTVNVSKPVVNVREKLAELDKPTGIAGEAMLRAETPQEQQALIGVGRRNLLINGGFDVWQRGTSGTHTASSGYGNYVSADRWGVYYNNTKIEKKNYTIDGAYKNVGRITSVGGNDVYFYQMVEGASAFLADQTVTYSYWARANKPTTISGNNIFRWGGTNMVSQVANAAPNHDGHYVDTEWRKISHTVTLNTDSSGPSFDRNLFFLIFASNGVTDDYIEITDVQLELGKVATPFEQRSYGEELALCQRYYYRIDGNSGNNTLLCMGQGTSTSNVVGNISFPVTMRARPTALDQSGTASDYLMTNASGSAQNCTSVPTFNVKTSEYIASVLFVSTGNAAQGEVRQLMLDNTTDSFLAWSAEL